MSEKLTEKQQWVLNYLRACGCDGATPSEIGMAYGVPHNGASASVAPQLKRLVSLGLIWREPGPARPFLRYFVEAGDE